MRTKRWQRLAAACVIPALAAAGCGSSSSSGSGGAKTASHTHCPVNVLMITQQSGPLVTNGTAAIAGARASIAAANKSGGVLGCPLKLTIKDNGSDQSQDVPLAESALSSQSYAAVLVADFGAPTVVPFLTERKTLELAAYGGPGFAANTQQAPYAFDSDPVGSYAAVDNLKNAIKQGHSKIALFTDNTTFGQAVVAAAKKAVPAAGGQIASVQELPSALVNATPAITRARASGADAIFLDLYGPAAGHVLTDLKSSGWSVPVYGGQNTFATNLPTFVSPADYKGVVVAGPRVGVRPSVGAAATFAARLKSQRVNIDQNLFLYAISSDDITLLAWAANGAKSTSATAVAKYLEQNGTMTVPNLVMSNTTGYSATNHELVPSGNAIAIANVGPLVGGQWPSLASR